MLQRLKLAQLVSVIAAHRLFATTVATVKKSTAYAAANVQPVLLDRRARPAIAACPISVKTEAVVSTIMAIAHVSVRNATPELTARSRTAVAMFNA